MWRCGIQLAVVGLGVALSGAAAALAQPVAGDVVSVGFQASVDAKSIARRGQWMPILLQIQAQGSDHFQGQLQVERVDLDGDLVVYTEQPVALTANEGVKRVWCYAVSRGEQANGMDVDVVSDGGALINRLHAPDFSIVSNDTQIILDVSQRPVSALHNLLDAGANSYGGSTHDERGFYRRNCVATLPFRDLPDRWIGLEAADVIVWDEPNIDALSAAQTAALIEWVRNGGQLVLGIGPTWPALSKSPLAAILPLQGDEPPVETQDLSEFRRAYAVDREFEFKAPMALAVGKLRSGAVVLKQDQLEDKRVVPLIALQNYGSGRVIASAARIRDLLEASPKPAFFNLLVDVNEHTRGYLDELTKKYGVESYNTSSLYGLATGPIEFRSSAGQFVVIVGAFVFAYILLSTGGAWIWLKRKSLTTLSWPVFAGFAVIGSLLSLGAVSVSRGVISRLHSVTVYDMEAGQPEARAIGFFGYRSPIRQSIDLALHGDTAFLRPLSHSPDNSASDYATPLRYAALPDKARLDQVKMRATLKQFEGRWETKLEAAITGQLSISRTTGELTPDSWIKSDLDADISGGYLFFIDPRLVDETGAVPARAAGLTTSLRRGSLFQKNEQIPPAANVLAVAIPQLKTTQKAQGLGAKVYQDLALAHGKWASATTPDPNYEPELPTLWALQNGDWASSLRVGAKLTGMGIDPAVAALGLLSTRNLYQSNGYSGQSNYSFSAVDAMRISSEGLMSLDITHWLERGQAVLMLFSDQPGSAALDVGGKAKAASEGRTIYRVRMPVSYVP